MALIQNKEANRAWKKKRQEEEQYLNSLVASGKTASGRDVQDTLAMPKNAKYSQSDFMSKQQKFMSNMRPDTKLDDATKDIQDMRTEAYWAKKYLEANAEKIDAKSGAGSASSQMDYLDEALAELDRQNRGLMQRDMKAQQEDVAKRFERKKSMGWEPPAMSDELQAAANKRKTQAPADVQYDENTIAEQALHQSKGYLGSKNFASPQDAAGILQIRPGQAKEIEARARESAASGTSNKLPSMSAVRENTTEDDPLDEAIQNIAGRPIAQRRADEMDDDLFAAAMRKMGAAVNYDPSFDPATTYGLDQQQADENYAQMEKTRVNRNAAIDAREKGQAQRKAMLETRYSAIPLAKDFEVYKKKGSDIQNPGEAGSWFGAAPNESGIGNKVEYYRNNPLAALNADDADASRIRHMTTEEVNIYNYLLAKDQENNTVGAQEYFNQIKNSLGKRVTDSLNEASEQLADEHPVLGSIASVGSNALSTAGYVKASWQAVSGQKIDPYDSAFGPSRITSGVRGKVTQNINATLGEGSFAATLATMAYSAVMSSADSGVAALTGTGLVGLSGSAATSTTLDALSRGATDVEALVLGGIAGVAEAATEKLPMDRLFKAYDAGGAGEIRALLGQILKGAIEEAPGEMLSEFIADISDQDIMREMSNWSIATARYQEQGMSEQEAAAQANYDVINNILIAGGTGALSAAGSNMVSFGLGKISGDGQTNTDSEAQTSEQELTQLANEAYDEQMATQRAEAMDDAGYVSPAERQDQQWAQKRETLGAERADAMDDTQYAAIENGRQAQQNLQIDAPAQMAEDIQTYDAQVEMDGESDNYTAQNRGTRTGQEFPGSEKSPVAYGIGNYQQAKTADKGTDNVTPAIASVAKSAQASVPFAAPERAQLVTETGASDIEIQGIRAIENGQVYFDTTDSDGTPGVARAEDVAFADEHLSDLLAVGEFTNMTPDGVSEYLKDYDVKLASPEAYAQTYANVANRARIGMSYRDATQSSLAAMNYLSERARLSAFSAGLAVRNKNAVQSSQNTPRGVQGQNGGQSNAVQQQTAQRKGRMVRAYSNAAFQKIGDAKRRKQAGMELNALNALAKKYNIRMRVVDSIDVRGTDGKVRKSAANGQYNPRTGEITIALDAIDNAYLYVGMHELTHLLREEHAEQWDGFTGFVKNAIENNGQDFDALVQKEMQRTGLNKAAATEEVIANTVPAILQDENNLRDLLATDQKLFARVMEWLNEFVTSLKEIGQQLSGRQEWAQLDALKEDTAALNSIWLEMKDMLAENQKAESQRTQQKQRYSKKHWNALDNYTEHERERWKDNQRILLADSPNDVSHFIDYAMSQTAGSRKLYMGKIDGVTAAKIEEATGVKLLGYNVTLREAEVRKMFTSHGSAETELPRGQRPVTRNDIADVVSIVTEPDEILLDDRLYNNSPVILFKKTIRGRTTVVTYATKKHYDLAIQTMYSGHPDSKKESLATPSDVRGVARPQNQTPEAASGTASFENSIAPDGKKINTDKNKFSLRDGDTERIEGSEVEIERMDVNSTGSNAPSAAMHNGFTAVSGHKINAVEADTLARTMLRAYSSQYDRAALSGEIADVMDFAENGGSAAQVEAAMHAVAKKVLEQSRTLDMDHEARMKPLREVLRNTSVKLTSTQWAEAVSMADSAQGYRRALFGKVRISQNANQTLDQAWAELNALSPELFPADASETDMPRLLWDAVDTMRPVFRNEYGMSIEEGARYASMQLMEDYLKLPAVKAAAKTQRQLGIASEELRKAMTDYRRQSKAEFDAALASVKAARANQQKTAQQQRVAAMRQKYTAWRAADLKSRRSTELRSKIRAISLDLATRLTHPKGEKYIPEHLLTAVAQISDTMVNAMQVEKGADTKIGEKIRALAAGLEGMKHVEDADYQSEDYDGLRAMADRLAEEIADSSVHQMSFEQLASVHNLLKGIQVSVMNAKKLIGRKDAIATYDAGTQTMRQVNAARGYTDTPLGRFMDMYVQSMLGGIRFFRRMTGYVKDSVLVTLAEEMNDGQRKAIDIQRQGKAMFAEFADTPEKQKWLKKFQGQKAELVDVGLTDENGKAVPITRSMVVSLYLHSQNGDNLKHLMTGGMVVPEWKAYQRGDLKQAYTNGTKVTGLTKEAIARITDTMTTEESALASKAYGFFNSFTKKHINETSVLLNGYRKAAVQDYYPIRTDANYLVSNFESIAMDKSLDKPGWLVERKKASQPIYLEDVVNVIERQLDAVSKYAGMAVPVRNFNKVWNTSMSGYTDSVKGAVARKWGVRGQNYVENLMADLQGARKQPDRFFGKIKGNFAGSALMLNINVFLQQASSYVTAGSEIGWAPLAKALLSGGKEGRMISRADTELIAKYTPLLWYRSQGLINTDIGDAVRPQDWTGKLPWLFGWIEKSDAAVSGRLWYAAQYYVKDARPDLVEGSEAFYKETAKMFNQIMENTQANYTTMQLQSVLRSPSKIVKSLTMFMTQTLQNFGILYDAYGEYDATKRRDKAKATTETQAQRKQASVKLRNAITTQAAGAITVAVMQLLARVITGKMNPYRDDDDEISAEGIVQGVALDSLGTVFGSVLGGREAWSWLTQTMDGSETYDVEVAGVAQINEFAASVNSILTAIMQEKDDKQVERALKNLLYSTTTLLGIPYRNGENIVKGVMGHIKDLQNGEFGSYNANRTWVTQNLVNAALDGIDGDNTAERTKIKDALIASSKAQDPKKTVEQNVRTALKGEYLRLLEEDALKAAVLGQIILAEFGGTADGLEKWVTDAQMDTLRAAIDGRDMVAAVTAMQKRRDSGAADSELYQSLRGTYKKKMREAYAAGETDVLAGYMNMLEGIDLRKKDGKPYFTDAVFDDMISDAAEE